MAKTDPPVLRSLTTFIGGGGPRFWASLSPEPRQSNYAQVLVEVNDKHYTNDLLERAPARRLRRDRRRAGDARSNWRPPAGWGSRWPSASWATTSPRSGQRPSGSSGPCARSRSPRRSRTTGAPRASRCGSRWIPIGPTSPASPTPMWQRQPPPRSTATRSARCARATGRSPSSAGSGWRSAPSSATCRTSTFMRRRAR